MNKPLVAGVIITAISFAAVAFLFWLIYAFEVDSITGDYSFLPSFNASLNFISATCVAIGIVQIKRGNQNAHRRLMASAFIASTLFLIGYICHHAINGDTKFLTQGILRPIYFTLLISHILLSIVALPLVLNTIYFAVTKKWAIHKRLAKFTYPIWLYVSITGIIVFVFLRFLNHS